LHFADASEADVDFVSRQTSTHHRAFAAAAWRIMPAIAIAGIY